MMYLSKGAALRPQRGGVQHVSRCGKVYALGPELTALWYGARIMPKPVPEASGNGLHLNLSLARGGKNIFVNAPDRHSPEAESFIAGILAHVREMTAFLNPLPNSYERR